MAKVAQRKSKQDRRRQAMKHAQRRRRRSFWRKSRNVMVGAAVLAAVAVLFISITREEKDKTSGAKGFTGGDFHSMVSLAGTPERLVVGGHEAVSISTDQGKNWRRLAFLDDADAMGWADLGETIIVGGHPGLTRSDDGGKTFRRANEGLPATDVHSLGGSGTVVYAGTPAGLLRSEDSGRTWRVQSPNEGRSFMGRILVDSRDLDHLMAPDMSKGAVVSTDAGRTWRSLVVDFPTTWISWNPANTNDLVATGQSMAARSTDGGKTWSDIDVPKGATIIEFSASGSGALFAGVHDGSDVAVWVSSDGGASWKRS